MPFNRLRYSYLIFVFLMFSALYSVGYTPGYKPAVNGYVTALPDCTEIEVEVQLVHTSKRKANGEILLVFKENQEQYTLFVFAGDSKDNQLGIKTNKVTELKKGEYNLYIQSKTGCTKHIKARIN
jgi:hypothetical protein